MSFPEQSCFLRMKPRLMVLSSSSGGCAVSVRVRNVCLNQGREGFLPISSRRFRMSGLTCRSTMYAYLIFVHSLQHELGCCFFPCVYPIITTPWVGPVLMEWLLHLYQKSIGLVCMRLFVDPVSCSMYFYFCAFITPYLLFYDSFVVNLEIRRGVPPILFLRIVLAVSVPSLFHINFRNKLLLLHKDPPGVFTGIVLNISIRVEKIGILTISRLPIHERGMSLLMKVFLLMSVIMIWYFTGCRSCKN